MDGPIQIRGGFFASSRMLVLVEREGRCLCWHHEGAPANIGLGVVVDADEIDGAFAQGFADDLGFEVRPALRIFVFPT